jgi:hypothetical protein
MGRGRLSFVAVGLAVAAVLVPATGMGQAKAPGGGKIEVQQALTAGYLSLGKEKGYQLALSMPNERIVIFSAVRSERLKDEHFSAGYSVYVARNRGNLERGVVRARFGSLGRVSLRFRPSGRIRRGDPRSGCEGGTLTARHGGFAGRLSFRGEGNYFHVASPKGAGYVAHSPRLRCEQGEAEEHPPRSLRAYAVPPLAFSDEHSIALLYASARGHGRSVGIAAMHREGSAPGADVDLKIVEPRDGMVIGHGAFLDGLPGTLLTSRPGAHPATATLAPAAPFYGEAAYSEDSDAWTGNFGVRIAGLSLSLTGPDFRVRLCVVDPLKDKDGCNFFKTEPVFIERPTLSGWMLR